MFYGIINYKNLNTLIEPKLSNGIVVAAYELWKRTSNLFQVIKFLAKMFCNKQSHSFLKCINWNKNVIILINDFIYYFYDFSQLIHQSVQGGYKKTLQYHITVIRLSLTVLNCSRPFSFYSYETNLNVNCNSNKRDVTLRNFRRQIQERYSNPGDMEKAVSGIKLTWFHNY